eukprot:CAMPEP_0183556312 /NCGR_PEP_ID=MMETSP0371-20130417/82252_1 /TAXON_ID=268820 /ORGANISM="Peridinium aciculiferum, Strain PAER-2" /LENGTH=60 /DNA_ID=CAMNT_0025762877 /DNA_START=110 /DNA_END=289 /DNA_ORIENTATION=+
MARFVLERVGHSSVRSFQGMSVAAPHQWCWPAGPANPARRQCHTTAQKDQGALPAAPDGD